MDYRPALRERSGVGEYAYQLARALLAAFPAAPSDQRLDLTLFSSSWKDRFDHHADIAGAKIVDRRVSVNLLNLAWHRLEWPPVADFMSLRPLLREWFCWRCLPWDIWSEHLI